MSTTRRQCIENTIKDLVINLLYYDRKEDGDLPVGAIEQAVAENEITRDQMVGIFATELTKGLTK